MATVQSKIRNFYLGAAELKRLTGWPDIVIETFLSLTESIIEISEAVDENKDEFSLLPAQRKVEPDNFQACQLQKIQSSLEDRISALEVVPITRPFDVNSYFPQKRFTGILTDSTGTPIAHVDRGFITKLYVIPIVDEWYNLSIYQDGLGAVEI